MPRRLDGRGKAPREIATRVLGAGRRGIARLANLLAVASTVMIGLSGCSADSGTGPGAHPDAPMPVSVSASLSTVQQTAVAGVTVGVSGPGITAPIIANLTVNGATVSGLVIVPTGSSRVFTVHAFDAAGIETYQGTATLVVKPGANISVTITLIPLVSGTPITITISTFTITITPNAPTLAVGASTTLTAVVTDGAGKVVPAPQIQWGSSNPVVASVTAGSASTTATLVGGIEGQTDIVASYLGSVALVSAVVSSAPSGTESFRIATIAVGYDHVCALSGKGALYCWGSNEFGQFGNGATSPTPSSTPALVPGLAFTSISAGYASMCGVGVGVAYCWGHNDFGQVGSATTTTRATPALLPWPFNPVFSGDGHACGLLSIYVYCWGSNASGELGVTPNDSHSSPVQITTLGGIVKMLDAGPGYTCATSTAGGAFCWGAYPGSSAPAGSAQATTIQIPSGAAAVDVAAQDGASCFADAGGAVFCAGQNAFGQLGDGSVSDGASLVRVALPQGAAAVQIVAGTSHACARTAAGGAYCWGLNTSGQLGNGVTQGFSSTPVSVALPAGVVLTEIAAGGYTTCGTSVTGAAYCWGVHFGGTVPAGATHSRSVPTLVVFP